MFDCYPIKEINIKFTENHIGNLINWDLNKKSYFAEAHAINRLSTLALNSAAGGVTRGSSPNNVHIFSLGKAIPDFA
ncbi:hypothetical protein [Paraglaciecola sp.]|uniref:hypothetical protein n=1 Tax=Paraglaciecola sp. TaxID=1920173 RepID=UPI0030F38621